jgi:hypothetical protein
MSGYIKRCILGVWAAERYERRTWFKEERQSNRKRKESLANIPNTTTAPPSERYVHLYVS